MSRYRIETGTVTEARWVPGRFHDAINAASDHDAVLAVRQTLAESGFSDEWGDHARVLDPERREIARVALDRHFWEH